MEFIKSPQVVARLKSMLGITGGDTLVKNYIFEAVMEIGTPVCIVKTAAIEIDKNCRVKKPIDYVGLKDVFMVKNHESKNNSDIGILSSESDKACQKKSLLGSYCIRPRVVSCPTYCEPENPCKTSEQVTISPSMHDTFQASSNANEHFTHVVLQYYASPVDEEGDPLVPSGYLQAVKAYALLEHIRKIRVSNMLQNASRNNPVSLGDIQIAERSWKNEYQKAYTLDFKMTPVELMDIGDSLMYDTLNVFPPRLATCYKSYISRCIG